ncbi:MAG: DUF3152 domain-containing protein [Acidimicrobiia bacterium]|nr:DUF3152 domain-containing protein [Acidimicrobiia bacterium]
MRPESTPRAAVLLLAVVLVTIGAVAMLRRPPPEDTSNTVVAARTTSATADTSTPDTAAESTPADPVEPGSTTTRGTTAPTAASTTSTTDTAIPVLDPATCLTGVPGRPTGRLVTVAGSGEPSSSDPVRPYRVAVEDGLGADPECFAAFVERVLGDERSWGGLGGFALQRVDDDTGDFDVVLASPDTTDSYCAPLKTNGIFSCWADGRAMINVWRWEVGIAEYADALDEYRIYVVNHEVGHAFGHNHVECPEVGTPAPVMIQQTKGLDGCAMNGWPLPGE